MNVVVFVPAVLLGLVGGVLGALFTRLNATIVLTRRWLVGKIPNKTVQNLVKVLECVALVVSTIPCRNIGDTHDTCM